MFLTIHKQDDDMAPPTPAEVERYVAQFNTDRNVTLQGVTESVAFDSFQSSGLPREDFAKLWYLPLFFWATFPNATNVIGRSAMTATLGARSTCRATLPFGT